MRILGITAWHREPAAVLLVDGQPVAACKETWRRGVAGAFTFPSRSIRACLDRAGTMPDQLDRVVFGSKPIREFERQLVTGLQTWPKGTGRFAGTMAEWLGDRLWVKNQIVKVLGVDAKAIAFAEHHRALAAAAFYRSVHDRAAILVVDDVAEWATTTIARGDDSGVTIEHEIAYPDSLGLQQRAVTEYLGFDPDTQRHFVAALATHGAPRFADRIQDLDSLGAARVSGEPLHWTGDDRRHADIAASWQQVFNDRLADFSSEAKQRTGLDNLFVTCFDNAAAAFGAALLAHHEAAGERPNPAAATGAAVDDDPRGGTRVEDPIAELAQRLRSGERVAWVRGAIEFATRSDTNRLLLAAADTPGLLAAVQYFEPFLAARRLTDSDDPGLAALLDQVGPLQVADFALRGGSIVETAADAHDAFARSQLDAMIVSDHLVVPADAATT